jgi:hypothetical protein
MAIRPSGGVGWIERVGMPVEQLDSRRDLTRFIERQRGQGIGGNNPDDRD